MRSEETKELVELLNEVDGLTHETFVDWLNRTFLASGRLKPSRGSLNMRIRLEAEIIDKLRGGQQVSVLMKTAFKEFKDRTDLTAHKNLGQNFSSFMKTDYPKLQHKLVLLENFSQTGQRNWVKARLCFMKIIQNRIRKIHPGPLLGEERAQIVAEARGGPIQAHQVRLVGICKKEFIDLQAYYGISTNSGLLNEIFLHHSPQRQRSEESQTICDDIETILKGFDGFTDKELFDELSWLAVDYGKKRKEPDESKNSTRRTFFTREEYKILHGNVPASEVISRAMKLFSETKLPDMTKFNRNSVKDFLRAHLRLCSGVSTPAVESRRRLNFYNWLGEMISECYGVPDGRKRNLERGLPLKEIQNTYIHAKVHVKLYEFKHRYGFYSVASAVHYLIDPGRKFW